LTRPCLCVCISYNKEKTRRSVLLSAVSSLYAIQIPSSFSHILKSGYRNRWLGLDTQTVDQIQHIDDRLFSCTSFRLCLLFLVALCPFAGWRFFLRANVDRMRHTVILMSYNVFQIALHRVLSYFLKMITRNSAFVIARCLKFVLMVQSKPLASFRGHNSPPTIRGINTNILIPKKEQCCMFATKLSKCVAFFAILFRDRTTMSAKSVSVLINLFQCFERINVIYFRVLDVETVA